MATTGAIRPFLKKTLEGGRLIVVEGKDWAAVPPLISVYGLGVPRTIIRDGPIWWNAMIGNGRMYWRDSKRCGFPLLKE